SCSPFHIIGPGIFFIPVGSAKTVSLLITFLLPAQGIKFLCILQTGFCKYFVSFYFDEDLVPQCERGCRSTGQVFNSGSLTFIFRKSLRFARCKINWSKTINAPAIIGVISVWKFKISVVAVVSHLVIKFVGTWVKF